MLASLFLAAAPLFAASTDTTASWLAEQVSRPGLESLRSKGYVVLQGDGKTERLQHVHWKTLDQLNVLAGSALRFADSLRAVAAGQPAKSAPEDLDRLAALPPQGLMTPSLQTAAQGLSALQRQLAALGAEGRAASAVLAERSPMFSTPWGAKLAAETRADLADDPAGLVDRFFTFWLAGPAPEQAAVAHFTAWADGGASKSTGARDRLAADARAGRLSSDMRRLLEDYLSAQRRLAELKRLNESLAAHAKQSRVQKELAALEAAARGLGKPELLRELEARPVPEPAASPRPRLTSAGVHMQEPTRLAQYELGDEALVSGGYWVDGLKEGESVEVEETTFAERPTGLETLRVNRVKRANGGPYPYTARLPIAESRDLVFQSIVSAHGSNALVERLTVPVSRDFEVALGKLAQIDAAVSACRFDAAPAALAGELAGPAKEKKQYEGLRKAAEQKAKDAADHAKTLAKLEALIADSHADAAPETCSYQTDRTADALAVARKLPAGCDRYVPALERRLWDIRKRKDAQAAYQRWAADARSKRKSCAFAAASESAAAALAVLDAEPAARCGKQAEDASLLEKELLEARAAEGWRARLTEDLAAAEKISAPEARLAAARAVSARAASLSDAACLAKEREKADKLAWAASDLLDVSTATAANAVLPGEGRLARIEAEVAAERRSALQAAQAASGRLADEQLPASAPSKPAPVSNASPDGNRDGGLPAAETAAAPVKGRSRLQCLEDGRKANNALIDCEGKPFKIMELKRLRDAANPERAPKRKTGAR